MTEKKASAVSKEQQETKGRTRHQLDEEHLKAFIKMKLSMPENNVEGIRNLKAFIEKQLWLENNVESVQRLNDLMERYCEEAFQDESLIFRILKLKSEKRIKELQGEKQDAVDAEISRLEKIYFG